MTTQRHTDYDPEMYTVLASLGWTNNPDDYPTRYGELKNSNEGALVFRPIKTKYDSFAVNKTRFKLGVSHHDAIGVDEIPFHEFDTSKPRWKQSVFVWHATTTFKLAEIRAKHAERDAQKQRVEKRQKESWEALCAGSKAMDQLAIPYTYDEHGDVDTIRVHWEHRPYMGFNPLANLTVTERADKVRRLCEFLKSEGWAQ